METDDLGQRSWSNEHLFVQSKLSIPMQQQDYELKPKEAKLTSWVTVHRFFMYVDVFSHAFTDSLVAGHRFYTF